jgi:Curli production assembly/transport component CsgG/FecR protein
MLTRIHRVLALAAIAVVGGTANAQTLDGRVVQTRGDVRIDGTAAQAGQTIKGNTIVTGVDGTVQLRLSDGTVIALPPASQIKLSAADARQLTLARGGLMLATQADRAWRVDLGNRSIRSNGFLRLQDCAAGCPAAPGLYGRISAGEAVLEYQGGRSVLRGRSFRWDDAASRPEVLANPPALLDSPSSQNAAVRARGEVAQLLKTGLDSFNAGNDAQAVQALQAVRNVAPGETVVPYYLGLIALRREDSASALTWLQQYVREDPEGAAQREVPKILTLLSSAQLQQEVAAAVAREREVVASAPEPGSIAVQAFVNQGSDNYRALAKGLAAMIIADLSKVPGLKVLEREKVQLLVNEAKLGDSGLADKDSAVRSGRLMRAEKVVVGNFEVQ